MLLTEVFETAKWELRKFHGDSTAPEDLYEVIEGEGNLLMYGGASALWHRLIGGTTVVAYDDTNSRIGVGDSSTASTATMTDLQAATNKMRKVADQTHTDGTVVGSASMTFVSTFATGDANWVWNEWAIFNGDGANTVAGRMLCRRVEALGTKTSAATWQLTITLSLGGGA